MIEKLIRIIQLQPLVFIQKSRYYACIIRFLLNSPFKEFCRISCNFNCFLLFCRWAYVPQIFIFQFFFVRWPHVLLKFCQFFFGSSFFPSLLIDQTFYFSRKYLLRLSMSQFETIVARLFYFYFLIIDTKNSMLQCNRKHIDFHESIHHLCVTALLFYLFELN